MEQLGRLFRLPALGEGKPLSEEQKRRRARFVVYPLMVVFCAGFLFLVYSPSKEERAENEKGRGFNTEIPSPERNGLEGNKREAYEKALMEKEKEKRRTFFDAAASMFRDEEHRDSVHIPEETLVEPCMENVGSRESPVRSSAGAYRRMNRTLGNIYEPEPDPEKERLLERIEELERMNRTERREPPSDMEEKMALMEKSYELAARYNGKTASSHASSVEDKREHTAAMPVKRMRHQVVSSLSRPVSDEEFIATFTGERNTDFHTPIGKTLTSDKNTIGACVHGTQTVSDGQVLRIRLLEPMVVDDRFIPRGTVLVGGTRIEGERLDIRITAVEYKGTVLPVELEVYDADGQQGILVPNSMEYDAAREIAANMGSSMNSSINISTDAGAQIASDLGKGVIQGVSQYITKKMRTVKITLKAGHKLLLHSPDR